MHFCIAVNIDVLNSYILNMEIPLNLKSNRKQTVPASPNDVLYIPYYFMLIPHAIVKLFERREASRCVIKTILIKVNFLAVYTVIVYRRRRLRPFVSLFLERQRPWL